MSLAEQLAPIELDTASGGTIRLATLWSERPLLLTFLRHFGWIFCREWVAQLRDRAAEIDATGTAIAAIGCGPIAYAEALRKEFALPFPLLADPERKSFSALALRRDLFGVASPRAMGHALRAFMGGSRQRGVHGDPLQLGGTFVITPEGDTVFEHRSREAGDDPEWATLLAALR